ncbi:SH3 domain-containing kinase-binding protein 1 [Clinocottus analis]|uniref:SH3 domain-containing kinase-binding protein 1 n=1 Tax=Clinocottus analis TaxID=304258 RepID=UPI0035BEEA48
MQRIYMHSNEHFEVFTTVLAPQGRHRYRAEAETMVVVHSYKPHWPDELELSLGDVILVLPKHEEERWYGRLQGGQQGYFPASCVMELSQVNLLPKAVRRSLPLRSSAGNDSGVRSRHGNGHIRQALRRGSRGVGEGGVVLDGGQGENEGPFPVRRHQIPVPLPVASQPQTHKSPSLLHRILSKCRKKTECQGSTNGAFEGD